MDFPAVVAVVVEFEASLASQPLAVAPALGAQGIPVAVGLVPDLRESGLGPLIVGVGGVPEKRAQRQAIEIGRSFQSAKVRERGVEIEQLDGLGNDASCGDAWSGDDEGHAGGEFEGRALVPETFLSEAGAACPGQELESESPFRPFTV